MKVAILGSRNSAKALEGIGTQVAPAGISFQIYTSASDFVSEAAQGEFQKAFISTDLMDGSWLDVVRTVSTSNRIPDIHMILVASRGDRSVRESRDLLTRYQIKDILHTPVEAQEFLAKLNLSRPDQSSQFAGQLQLVRSTEQAKVQYRDELLNACKIVFESVETLDSNDLQLSKGYVPVDKATFRKQKAHILHLIKSDPKNYNYKFKMVTYFTQIGDEEKARQWFDQIKEELAERDDIYWLNILGHVCVAQGCLGFASAITRLLAEKASSNQLWHVSILRAKIQLVAGDLTQAEVWLNEAALNHREENAEILNLRGIVLKRDGDLQGATDALTRAFNLQKNDHRIAFNLGLNYEKLGYKSDSITWYRKSLTLFPGFQKAMIKLGEKQP